MAAQPPKDSRIAEIDIREILTDSTSKPQAAPELISRGFEPATPAGDTGLLGHHGASRIGWPDWANILFAVLTVAGGLLSTFRYFESHEAFRSRHLREGELLYGRPVEFSSAVPDQIAAQPAGSSRTPSGAAPSGAATGANDLNKVADSGPIYHSPASSTPGSNFTNLPNGGTGDQTASHEARGPSSSASERSNSKTSRQRTPPPKTHRPVHVRTHSSSQTHSKFVLFRLFHWGDNHSKHAANRTSATAAAKPSSGIHWSGNHSKQAAGRTSPAAAARPPSSAMTHSFDRINGFNNMAIESLRRGMSPDTRIRPAMERVAGRHGRQ